MSKAKSSQPELNPGFLHFHGIKFYLDGNGNLLSESKKRLSYRRLYKLFNPSMTTIYLAKNPAQKSRRRYIMAYSKYFHMYYFHAGLQIKSFPSRDHARRYLKKFTRHKFTSTNPAYFMMYIASFNLPNYAYLKFLDPLTIQHTINEYLTLKLDKQLINEDYPERGFKYVTNIYVVGEKFRQCKFLLFNLDTARLDQYDEIRSIDEARETLDNAMEGKEGGIMIPSITEFWGHCSNLSAWAEYDYDTRILDSQLAFPLLKKLSEAGDPTAKRVFKDEIASRFENGIPSTRKYLKARGYLKHFTAEEKNTLLTLIDKKDREEKEKLKDEFFNLLDELNTPPKFHAKFSESFSTLLGHPSSSESYHAITELHTDIFRLNNLLREENRDSSLPLIKRLREMVSTLEYYNY